MNRTIKFRGKRIDDGKWIYGGLCNYLFEGKKKTEPCIHIGNLGYIKNAFYQVDPNTVGQFTGLLDKNGKEIYEGDILLLNTTGLREHCIVEWNSEKAGWCISLKVAGKWTLGVRTLGAWMNEADFRIQGNRFDNPELLNEK